MDFKTCEFCDGTFKVRGIALHQRGCEAKLGRDKLVSGLKTLNAQKDEQIRQLTQLVEKQANKPTYVYNHTVNNVVVIQATQKALETVNSGFATFTTKCQQWIQGQPRRVSLRDLIMAIRADGDEDDKHMLSFLSGEVDELELPIDEELCANIDVDKVNAQIDEHKKNTVNSLKLLCK